MAEKLFTASDKKEIEQAIHAAERLTSGEIQVHIETHCKDDVLDRAAEVFELLKMHKTVERNAVLFYLAVAEQKFAVLGDVGINRVVPDNFWEMIKNEMVNEFKLKNFKQGLILGITKCGEQLQMHFPFENKGKINELPDEISFG